MKKVEKTELQTLREAMVKIAELHGIVDPIQLIASAQNNEETYADILIREIEKHHLSLTSALEKAREAIKIAYVAMDDHYDGAIDSKDQWMVEPMEALRSLLGGHKV